MTALPTTPATTSFPVSPVISPTLAAAFEARGAGNNFVERRSSEGRGAATERRQFTNSHSQLSPAARELAEAIDQYKVDNRRRYITFEEMLQVITQLGYHKPA